MRALFLILPALLLTACAKEEASAPIYDSTAVERRTIEVSVGSAGIVEPLATVEVKSKASGEVLELLVETGDLVEQGQLMVRIDPRTVRNRLAQADAELKAALSRRTISLTQMRRAESLVKKGTFTEADLEQAALEFANAQSQVVSAEVSVENARIALDDTEIRAPITGTVIEKPVEKGQVISSPTQDFGGGTPLLKMANLSAVQIRALIDETDIGKVKPGMLARVTVAAYPNQPFSGEVLKIEPLAVVEQNVTMFAVLISIQNPEGLLMPGMNAEVDVSIARRENVLTIPVMALRTERDVETTAGILGMSPADVRAQIRAGGTKVEETQPVEEQGATISMMGRTIELPRGIDPDAVRAAMKKRRSGASLDADEQKLVRKVFAGANGAGSRKRSRTPASDYRFGGDFWVVVEMDNGDTQITPVRGGITDLDRVEIIYGLEESDRVLILPSAHLVETQEKLQQFINRRVGSVPGIKSK